jgi:hypothetical protein
MNIRKNVLKKEKAWTKLFHISLTLMLIFSGMTFLSVSLTQHVSAEWWNNSWSYKKSLTITNPFLDYQMRIVIGKDNASGITASCYHHCLDDFSDVRFVSGDTNMLPYWRQNYTSGVRATFWVNNSYNDSSINMYYGYPSATYAGDGNTTFDFFDDFNGTALNTHKWTKHGTPTLSFSNSAMTMVTNAAGDYIYHPVKFGKGTQIYSKIKFVNSYRGASIGYDLYGSPNTEPMMCIETNGPTVMDTNWADGSHYTDINNFNLQYTYFFNYLQRGVNRIWFYNNATLLTNTSTNIPFQSLNASIGYNNYGDPHAHIVIDFIAVMKFRDYTQHPPSWGSVGSQQTYGGSAPENQNPSPSDGAINVNLNPSVSITLVTPKGYLMDFHIKTNASGTWQTIASNHNVGNGTYTNSTTVFTKYNTKYWWNVSANNSLHEWSNNTYTFTTKSITTNVNGITPYNVTGPITITATGPSDLTNVTLWYRNSTDNATWNTSGTGVSWSLASNHHNGDGTLYDMDYPNKAVVKNAYKYGSITPANTIFAYAASINDDCLTILDCTKQWAITEFNHYPISNAPHDVYIMDYPTYGRVAFVLSYYDGMLHAINVTNPNSMTELDSIDSMANYGMYLSVDETSKILYATETQIGGDGNFLHAFDITNPNAITHICSVHLPRSNPWTPVVNINNHNYVYVAGNGDFPPYNSSISIINATWAHNITNPKMVYMKTQGYGCYGQIRQDGKYLYGNCQYSYQHPPEDYSLHIWDVSNPTNLTNVSITQLNTYQHFCLWTAPNGHKYAFTRHCTGDVDTDYGVNIVDLGDVYNPKNIGYIPYIGGVQELNRCHWEQVHYNNITGNYVLYVIGYIVSSWVAFNITQNTSQGGWKKFSVDSSYPWSWNFNFPNGTGYYEFFSIGQKTGSSSEPTPLTCDALCYYNPGENYPHNPIPTNNSKGVDINTDLSWSGGTPEDATYDVYFGASSTPPKVSSNQSATTYDPGILTLSTNYYWRIVEWINSSSKIAGPSWTFRTDSAPNQPENPSPANHATGIAVNTGLSWTSGDPDAGDTITYDVYFGILNPPVAKVSANQSASSYDPGALNYNINYYWKIVAWDSYGISTSGTIWDFTTENLGPSEPSNPNPAQGATVVAITTDLGWTGGDPDGDPVTYDVYFGITSTPSKVSANQSGTTYNPGVLSYGTTYYWKIVAWDNHGASTAGPIWNFKTNSLPNVPSNPNPPNDATGVPVNTVISWIGGDPDPGDTVTNDVYFGVTNNPPKVASNQSGTTYNPGTLSYGTTYYWKIVSWDNHGASTTGSVWDFKTNSLPNMPSNPNPSNNATSVSVATLLSWTGGDPDPGDTVTNDVYFGVTNNPPKVANNQSGTTYNPGTLSYGTTYYWKIVAWDNHGDHSAGPLWQFTTHVNTPPNAPVINGPSSGKAGKSYNYTFVAGDPEDDNISYEINWGDGTVDNWYGPVESNIIITRSHTWKTKGTYTIQARAKDIHGAIGEWGSLSVTMPMDQLTSHQQNLNLLKTSITSLQESQVPILQGSPRIQYLDR